MLINIDTGHFLTRELHMADNLWSRFWGLMRKKELSEEEGLLLVPCQGVHTFFMHFNIDILYLDRNYEVIEVFEGVKPWKVLPYRREAKFVLELPENRIRQTGTEKKHRLLVT